MDLLIGWISLLTLFTSSSAYSNVKTSYPKDGRGVKAPNRVMYPQENPNEMLPGARGNPNMTSRSEKVIFPDSDRNKSPNIPPPINPRSYGGSSGYTEPKCAHGCANGGVCIGHNVCKCAPGFSGDFCESKDSTCAGPPPTPNNSQQSCNLQTCTMTCREGYEFPDGSTFITTTCKRGSWIMDSKTWQTIPDCAPTCLPKCLNEGKCIGYNVCQCPKNFRGPQCQYNVQVCDPKKLGFNGNYECGGDAEMFTCKIKCPEGMVPSFPPADAYVCRYDRGGAFLPANPPKCVYENAKLGNDVEIIDMNSVKTTKRKPVQPQGGTCYMWTKEHYKLFSGNVVSFKSDCSFALLSDPEHSLKILTPSVKQNCGQSKSSCSEVEIFYGDKQYTLSLDGGKPVVKDGGEMTRAPAKLTGMSLNLGADSVTSSFLAGAVTFVWNYQRESIEIKVSERLWNQTSGLCGSIERNMLEQKTLKEFASLSRVESINSVCDDNIDDSPPCKDSQSEQKAHQFCNKLLFGKRFGPCRRIVDAKPYYDACIWEVCSCKTKNCGCESMAYYVKESVAKGVKLSSWRDAETCPIECSGGKIYNPCGFERTCLGGVSTVCSEGCHCPEGMFLDNGTCVVKDKCPCLLRGQRYSSGSTVSKECNTCTCANGEWSCSEKECPGRCEVVGDPHYTTFDRKTFDFMGKCSYYLVKMENYSIQAENVPCQGSVSQSLGFPPSVLSGMPSCTKSVTVAMGKTILKLKQALEISVNGEDHEVPLALSQAYVRRASSIFIQVILADGTEIWWDGITSVFINAPPSLKGLTKGLCGTFTGSQKDDFLTPEGDVESDAVAFANKWKIHETCTDRTQTVDACENNPQNKRQAEEVCSHLTSNLFAHCHAFVDPSKYYSNCLFDVCSCDGRPERCLCPLIASYAKECIYQGVVVEWRHRVRQCGLACPRGQVYTSCSDSCKLSCDDLSSGKCLADSCVEGCICPTGSALNRGKCVPISDCPCQLNGYQYPPGHREVRRSAKGPQLCTCENAIWRCDAASSEDLTKYPNNTAEAIACSSTKNQIYTNCEPSRPVTCQNMHRLGSMEPVSESVCHGGCVCKKGFVLDSITGECIRPESCPCHHGGRSYADGSSIQNDCNICKCANGKWNCTDQACPGVCTSWGNSHIKTFDSKMFDFQGACEYAFAKGALSKDDTFIIVIEMVACGTGGVSCPKSATLVVGSGDHQESVIFSEFKATTSKPKLSRISLREAGLFIFADVPDLGLVVQWDKGTRVTARLDPKWKNRVKGLCGNFNDDSEDDFQTPSGGITEASANFFCDSWKLHEYCPEPRSVIDTCSLHPERKVWASEKCSVLKSSIFKKCHSEVPVGPYMERCIYDTCGCDDGGDCECLCTALAAYSQECNAHGVPIRWRSQELCPIQCDQRCSEYSSCVPTCPVETCDTTTATTSRMCQKDVCIEGCELKECEEGLVYSNLTNPVCVPRSTCKPVCLIADDKTYYEGDLWEQDACHSCYCSRGKKVCSGEPCAPSTAVPTTTTTARTTTKNRTYGRANLDSPFKCTRGWSEWMNRDKPNLKKNTDIEPLPLPDDFKTVRLGRCDVKDMSKIECRTSSDKKDIKEYGEDVECSLERGLMCIGGCRDYEIRVYCACGEVATIPTTIRPTTSATSRDKAPFINPDEEEEGRSLTIDQCRMDDGLKKVVEDCTQYYQCEHSLTGNRWRKRNCSPSTFFNPESGLCEWPQIVALIRPECTFNNSRGMFTTIAPYIEDKGCLAEEEWDDCYIHCDQLCHYYEEIVLKNGVCQPSTKCSPGCKPRERIVCPPYKKWRDANTCVEEADCICKSKTGKVVKPGEQVNEGPCEVCQCISNAYICDRSGCEVKVNPTLGTTESIILLGTTILVTEPPINSPPPPCISNSFIPLDSLPDFAYSASSSLFGYPPSSTKLSADGIWKPSVNDKNQFLQIDLGRPQNVYGVIVKAIPEVDEYVTTYQILYSLDNVAYNYIVFLNKPELFSGPSSSYEKASRWFAVPVEARYLRIIPVAWVGEIALKVQLQGCSNVPRTSPPPPMTTVHIPVCNDLMSHGMSDWQISASSSLLKPRPNTEDISLSSEIGWIPAINAPNEFLQFDFMDVRNLTGLKTKGSGKELSLRDNYPSWVSAFSVHFSIDGINWSPISYKAGIPMVFNGNINDESVQTTIFHNPIRARYLRIIPVQWSKRIALRADVLGCYIPYPEVTTEMVTTISSSCNVCPGAPQPSECSCDVQQWWDGEQCISRTQCPCFIGFMSYSVGSTFEKEDCEQCVCGLNGVPKCTLMKCPPCEQGGSPTVNRERCSCTCKECPVGERMCLTSGQCVPQSLWCDGVVDCGNDEIDCPVIEQTTLAPTTPFPTTPKKLEKQEKCPTVECPPGFYANITNAATQPQTNWSPFGSASKWNSYFNRPRPQPSYGIKSKGVKKGSYNFKKHGYASKPAKIVDEPTCPQYNCVPVDREILVNECPPKPTCQPGFDLQIGKSEETSCNTYSCVVKQVPVPDGRCNVTGRTFSTFDGSQYKMDVCDHILIQDKEGIFQVRLVKECKYVGPCNKYLLIKIFNDTMKMNNDLTVELNNYKYSIPQLQKIGAETEMFAIKQVSDTFLLFSSIFEFSVIWDTYGDVKVIVPGTSRGKVEGLCGTFDGVVANDKSKPDGSLASTWAEFGDSWGNTDCEIRVCPAHIQQMAYKACQGIRDEPLSICATAVSLDKLVSQCVETMCTCLETASNNTEAVHKCACGALLQAVTECRALAPSLDLTGWRIENDCPVQCPDGLVFRECYRRACEPCCSELMVPESCPPVNECFPGCYCPEGLVRDGDRCVKPSDCRDCVCEGYGLSRFVSFDKNDFRFSSNCTYVLAQTMPAVKGPSFKIYGTYSLCDDGSGEVCLSSATIIIKDHIAYVFYKNDKIVVDLDGQVLDSLSWKSAWINVHETAGHSVLVCLVKLEVDLEFYIKGKGFSLKIPSHYFYDKTEGLCGNCNLNITDDFKTSSGEISTEVVAFGESWRVQDLPDVIANKEDSCHVGEKLQECVLPSPHLDPCIKLYEVDIFGRCHAVINPNPYVESCHLTLCKEEVSLCQYVETYVRACQTEGICLNWRSNDLCPFYCPPGLEYKYCTLGCTLTCDNYELYQSDPSACKTPLRESCICPQGKVMKDGICVNSTRCSPCDSEGHYIGDKWNPDVCTACTCTKLGVQCQKTQCGGPPPCPAEHRATSSHPQGQCCPTYTCIPEPQPECSEPVQPICGYGQEIQMETTSNGCQQFTCRCKPASECEDLTGELTKKREPGMVAVVDKSGCCPKVNIVCNVTTCPLPPECPLYHISQQQATKDCCPPYKCVVPEGKCLYTLSYAEDPKGGEKMRQTSDKTSLLKDVGDRWIDGPCRNCECKDEGMKGVSAMCTKKSCGVPPTSESYIYSSRYVNMKCCPIYVRTACKTSDGTIKQPGETWPDPNGNPCKTFTCSAGKSIKSAGLNEISIKESVQSCKTDCPLGWEYSGGWEPSVSRNSECCGACKQVGCVVDGSIKKPGDMWYSPNGCTNYTCEQFSDQMQVVTYLAQCPDVSACPKEYIEQDGCCAKCNVPPIPALNHSSCTPETMALKETVKAVYIKDPVHGDCYNLEPIKGLARCRGTCDSTTILRSDEWESECSCCGGVTFTQVNVRLACSDGFMLKKDIKVPESCTCSPNACAKPASGTPKEPLRSYG